MPELIPIKKSFEKKSAHTISSADVKKGLSFLENAKNDFAKLSKLISDLQKTAEQYVSAELVNQMYDIIRDYKNLEKALNSNDKEIASKLIDMGKKIKPIYNSIQGLLETSDVLSRYLDGTSFEADITPICFDILFDI